MCKYLNGTGFWSDGQPVQHTWPGQCRLKKPTFFFRKKSINVSMSFFCKGNTMCGPLYVRSGPVIPSSANSSDSSENFESKLSVKINWISFVWALHSDRAGRECAFADATQTTCDIIINFDDIPLFESNSVCWNLFTNYKDFVSFSLAFFFDFFCFFIRSMFSLAQFRFHSNWNGRLGKIKWKIIYHSV